ncbi:hypothetical protein P3X46_018985 [Hevea brasiliensis]|uniref:Uncharacterized protein n=2 Tax=Hevea brasiliensis TaxID=3981 RepID=A0A6A6KS73_HEVBR|nr:zinc finger CCCH domain-containing protein 2 [Hevea brasiliensis]KAF2290279.1 hypothetical protein GH714_007499 [Hevea brasiliensis]KAJ9170923.1 hypothetical protein P3X46_018985 [Hevea brasiliensis]
MSTICADQHKLYHSHQLFSSSSSKKPFKDLDIPPRKLLLGKKTLQESPDIMSPCYKSNLQKFLPFNDATNGDHDHGKVSNEDLDPYSSDHFRMYEFKVRRCNRSRSHDWTDCPFAHPGEKARRRDPRKYHYSGTVCPEFRRGACSRGDTCDFAHGVFECWLHPSRYRTEACKDGKNCKRKVCFFAHSPHQLRILPEVSCDADKYDKSLVLPCSSLNHGHCCCLACHSMISSPTSTLLGMSHLSPPLSPSLSPPLSPGKQQSINGFSPISRYSDRLSKLRSGLMSYKDVFTELMTSLEAMNVNNEAAASGSSSISFSAASNRSTNTPWMDSSFNGEDHHHQQLILSPSTPNPRGSRNFFSGDCSSKGFNIDEKINNNDDKNGGADPDLGWVNELLM